MGSPVLPPLAAGALVAGLAWVAFRAWKRVAELEWRARESAALEERQALILEEQALRDRLQAANQALERRAAALQRILSSTADLKAHLPLETVLANVARAAASSLGYRRALLSLHDRAEGTLVPRAHSGLSGAWPDLERLRLPADRFAVRGAEAGPASPTPPPSFLTGPDGEGRATVPLVAGGQLVGLLELEGPERWAEQPADAEALRGLFALQAVTAIRLARAHETTRLGSLRDALTGVANHGHFQETLYREVTRHERSGEQLALLLVDLDDFKAVNDRHGHPAGDAVLRGVVARLLASVREMDTVARYGGEEFAVILPRSDGENGLRVAERLRAAVAATPLHTGLAGPLRITVSIGLAVCPDDAPGKGGLIECADKALYAAKRTGKNRVVRFTRVPASAGDLLAPRP